MENKYYNAKQMKVDNPREAIDEFLGLPALQEEKGDWLADPTILSIGVINNVIQGFQRTQASNKIGIQITTIQ